MQNLNETSVKFGGTFVAPKKSINTMPEYQCCKLNANVVTFNWITNTALISQFLCSRKSDPTKKGLNSCETNQFSIFESNYTMAG